MVLNNMKSKVYFIPAKETDSLEVISARLKTLIDKSGVLDFIRPEYKTAVKIHFGEEGNTGFVKSEYVRLVCQGILKRGAKASLSDTNTLYRGRRTNSKDHLRIAAEHGFTKEAVGVDIVIPDDSKKENTIDLEINKKFIKTAKVVRLFVDADAIVGISHFKGHIMTGFGGALKNLGMGCATREGKLMQHADVSPVVYDSQCIGCGECAKICPAGAIVIKNKKSVIDNLKCIGCASCIAVCPVAAIDVPWESGGKTMQEKMAEYAFAVMKDKKGKTAFFNFAIKITKECDCLAKDDPRISPDVGILASSDPVSVDKASFDLINSSCGKDIFLESHPHRDGRRHLDYACKLGIGNIDYDLVKIE